jgi:glutathione S-transferase
MRFYDCSTAPSPRKVRLFIAEKGLEIPTVEVNLRKLEQQGPEFLGRNPAGTVPLLELDDGSYLRESLAICHYLEQLHPEPNLMGVDAKEQALVLMWNDIATFEGYLAIQEVLRNGAEAFKDRGLPGPVPYAQIPELVERGRRRCEVFFDGLDRRLAESPYVAGVRFTYADIVAYAYTGFAERVLKKDPAEGRGSLMAWRREIAERPAIGAAS